MLCVPRRMRNVVLVVCALCVSTFLATAHGADAEIEKEVKKMQSEAMDVDLLGLEYKTAKKRLENAFKKCGEDKCSTGLLAELHRDLAIVLVYMKDKKNAASEMKKAFELSSSLTISKYYLGDADVRAVWENASKGAKPAAPTASAAPTGPTPAGEAAGNLTLSPKQAPTGFALPIVITAPEGEDVASVKVAYKIGAMEKYRMLDAENRSGKWVVTIPCIDTQFVGTMAVYVRAYDSDKNEVDHHGTLSKPASIELMDALPEGVKAPTYPGGEKPAACEDTSHCPPGFPCGPAGEGEACDPRKCASGLECRPDAHGDKRCHAAAPPPNPGSAPKLWFGATFQLDVLYVGAGSDICKQQTWACTKDGAIRNDGSTGPQDVGVSDSVGIDTVKANPATGTAAGSGGTGGGPALGTMRVLFSVDYFIGQNLSLGGKLGYAFNGNPTENAKFLPFHAEGRLRYWLGQLDAKGTGFRPYLAISGGLAEFDAAVKNITVVAATSTKNTDQCGEAASPCVKGVTAYRLAGQGFVGLGAGGWLHLSPSMALQLGLTVLLPLPTFSVGVAPELGLAIGF